jgi:transcriptional regulator with XRE-family HTH domain
MEHDKWWLKFGKFPPEDLRVVTAGGKRVCFPDPLAVTKHYMKLKGFTGKKLANELGVTYNAARQYLASGIRFDQYSLRRALCIVLDIPPLLLGLDEQAIQEGLTDEVLGQLVYDYRNHKRWTQHQLGQALDPCLCKDSIALIEKGKRLDSMQRRRALSFLLSIPPTLLGLAEPPAVAPVPRVILPKTAVSLSGALPEYRNVQAQIFDSYYKGVGKECLPEVANQLQTLQQALTVANRNNQRTEIIDIQEIYHNFYVWQGREDCNYKLALSHANKGIELAQSILDETDWHSRDRLAHAYLYRSELWREYGDMKKAVQDADKAVHYANGTSSLTICQTYIEAGIVHALAGELGKGKAYGEALLERAGNMFPLKEEDPHYANITKFNRGFFHLRRAMALRTEEAIKDARDADNGSVTRRTLILNIEEANIYLKQGEYEEAAKLAVQSLDTARSLKSNVNIMRIGNLYQGLKDHIDIPEVARLSLFYLSQ